MTEKHRLDPDDLDLDTLTVEELDVASGGNTLLNNNCASCTCPDTSPPASHTKCALA